MTVNYISDINEAIKKGLSLDFAYIHEYSRVYLGNSPEEINTSELIEARFFKPGTEIRLFNLQGKLTAVELTSQECDHYIERTQPLFNPAKFGKSVCIRDYLEADSDGQMYVAYTCLSSGKEMPYE